MQHSHPHARRARALRLRDAALVGLLALHLGLALGRDPPQRPRVVEIAPQTAPAWRLRLLPGVGPVRAQRLERMREIRHLEAPADLLRVPGFGPAAVARIATTNEVRVVWSTGPTSDDR